MNKVFDVRKWVQDILVLKEILVFLYWTDVIVALMNVNVFVA